MNNSSKFFVNKECQYYPCHESDTELNCMFCYCPLYDMPNCPGTYKMHDKNGNQIKSCIDCVFPHIPENYDKVISILKHRGK